MSDMLSDESSKIKLLTMFKGLKVAPLAGGKPRLGKHVVVNVLTPVCLCLLYFSRVTQHD